MTRGKINSAILFEMQGHVPKKKRPASSSIPKAPAFKRPRQSGFRSQAQHIGALTTRRQETKNVDTAINTNIASATATWAAVSLVNGITQGVTQTNHIGRRVAISKLSCRWQLAWGTAIPTSLGSARHLIVYDNGSQGGTPAVTDILSQNNILAFMNLDNSERFLVLHDSYLYEDIGTQPFAGNNGGAAATGGLHAGKWTKKFNPPLSMTFNTGAGNTAAAIEAGAIWSLWCMDGSQTAGGGGVTIMNANFRTRFIDG